MGRFREERGDKPSTAKEVCQHLGKTMDDVGLARQIPPFALEAKPLTEEAKKVQEFEWADAEVGTRHRLGGAPDFLQDPIWPDCPDCGKRMTFYAQLDSIGDGVCIADCGMVYVFICLDCNETKSLRRSRSLLRN